VDGALVSLSVERIAELAGTLDAAALELRAVPKLTDAEPGLSLADAYEVQWALRSRRLAAGRRLTGLKMGLTSPAKMRQMGVETPIYGFLLDDFLVADGAELRADALIHPRVEAEIALVTRRPLRGPNCTLAAAVSAVDYAVPALEIIDSRYRDFRFDLPSVVADNASSAKYVVGSTRSAISGIDLSRVQVVLERNSEPVAHGAGAAVLGHPAQSLAMLANQLALREQEIPAGTFVMTGGITEAVAARPGDTFVALCEHLGSVSVRFI
jgi:2-oxo-3-hexenedioate decarboxylase